jgi:hypothetical protein
VLITREVARHPVEDDADALLVELVDQVHEALGRAEAAGGGEVAGGLVPPGAVERVLHDGEELDMGEAAVGEVLRQHLGELFVGVGAAAVGGAELPGADVHLVDGDGRFERLPLAAGLHPLVVVPGVVEVPDAGTRLRGRLVVDAEGVGLVDAVAVVLALDVVLVDGASAQTLDEAFPNAGALGGLERVLAGFPAVEIADDGDALGVGRPDAEGDALLAVAGRRVGAEVLVEAEVGALVEEVDVVRRHARAALRGLDLDGGLLGLGLGVGLGLAHRSLAFSACVVVHAGPLSPSTPRMPRRGMATQSGRLLSSYSTS